MNSVGTLLIFALMFLICADVAGRYLLNAPIKGAAEMVGYSIVAAVFLQMASTLRAGRFTRVEMLIEPLEAQRPAAGHAFNARTLTGLVVPLRSISFSIQYNADTSRCG
jgi:TRAP-type C4-dicarboxylate transport system permease small subunit